MLYLLATPPLMTVRYGGHEVLRPIKCYNTVTHLYEPELAENEQALWYIGDIVPTIVSTTATEESPS